MNDPCTTPILPEHAHIVYCQAPRRCGESIVVENCRADGMREGFVRGRSILDHVLELEGGMYEHSKGAPNLQGGLLLDFASIFPFISHAWLFRLPRHMRMPGALYDIIVALYTRYHHESV